MMSKAPFSQLDDSLKISRTTSPLFVSATYNPDEETERLVIQNHERFLSLSRSIREKLASVEISQKIQAIGKKYGFELLRLAHITRLVREYYFGEARLENFPVEIEKRMGASKLTAQEIARFLKAEIIDWDPWTERLAKLPKVSVREALNKFPRVADQPVTEDDIDLKNFADPVRPTVRNWLNDYVQHLGQTGHTSMTRMNYLFHGENGKLLSSLDREKLGIILKSFDDGDSLPIDPEKSEILFDVIATKPDESRRESPAPMKPSSRSGTAEDFFASYAQEQRPSFQEKEARVRSSAINFIHHVERPTKHAAPPPKPSVQYTKPYPSVAPPPRSETKLNPAPASGLRDDSPRDEMEFINPYPRPGTHESQIDKNIANISFSEGAPQNPAYGGGLPPAPRPVNPITRPTASAKPLIPIAPKNPQSRPTPSYRPEPLNPRMIYPHTGSNVRPEPKIEGNLVDLRGGDK